MGSFKSFAPTGLLALALTAALGGCGGGSDYNAPTAPGSAGGALAVTHSAVTLLPTELRRLDISGGQKPYKVTSPDPGVVLATVSDATLNVAGVAGSTTPVSVVVTDAANSKATVAVTVTNAPAQGVMALSQTQVAMAPGAFDSVTIVGGTPPFTAVSADTNVVRVSVTGTTLSVAGVGEANNVPVSVIDALGVTRTLSVSVAAQYTPTTGVALFTNIPLKPTLPPRASRTFTVGGGTAPYTVGSLNPAVVTPVLRGNALTLQTAQAGTTSIYITDDNGQQLYQPVTVQSWAAPLALSATSIFGTTGTLTSVLVAGGTPPYTMFSSSSGVGVGSVNGNVLTIQLVAPGNGSVTVTDAEFNTASLTLVASGAAILTEFGLTPAKVSISENLTRNTSGALQQTVISLLMGKAVAPVQAFSTHPRLLSPTVNGNVVEVRTPGTASAPVAPCVDLDTTVTITAIDAAGQTATSAILVTNNGACPS